MADVTTGNYWTPGETVSAYRQEGIAADATGTAAAGGTVAIVGLRPNTPYTLVGGTSGKRVRVTTSEDGLGAEPARPGAPFELSLVANPASVAANTLAFQNLTAPTGSVDVGDTVLFVSRTGTEALVPAGVGPIVTKDVIPIALYNSTAAPIDAASQTFRFLVLKKRTNI
jgi:hypothetical protein